MHLFLLLCRKPLNGSLFRKMSKKAPDILLSSPTSDEGDQLPVSIPSAPLEKRKDTGELDSHMSLTSSSLMQYTQPLSDEPKARPRRAASVSSASSMSIKDAMSRMGKPSPGLNTNDNHFLVSDKKACETHEDADKRVFEKSFHAVQQTVNFTKEFEHLHAHLHWRTENEAAGPLPCLKKATGCSPKRRAYSNSQSVPIPSASSLTPQSAIHSQRRSFCTMQSLPKSPCQRANWKACTRCTAPSTRRCISISMGLGSVR
jgi:hypothetical protein